MRLFYHHFYDKSIKFSENNTKITKFYNQISVPYF